MTPAEVFNEVNKLQDEQWHELIEMIVAKNYHDMKDTFWDREALEKELDIHKRTDEEYMALMNSKLETAVYDLQAAAKCIATGKRDYFYLNEDGTLKETIW